MFTSFTRCLQSMSCSSSSVVLSADSAQQYLSTTTPNDNNGARVFDVRSPRAHVRNISIAQTMLPNENPKKNQTPASDESVNRRRSTLANTNSEVRLLQVRPKSFAELPAVLPPTPDVSQKNETQPQSKEKQDPASVPPAIRAPSTRTLGLTKIGERRGAAYDTQTLILLGPGSVPGMLSLLPDMPSVSSDSSNRNSGSNNSMIVPPIGLPLPFTSSRDSSSQLSQSRGSSQSSAASSLLEVAQASLARSPTGTKTPVNSTNESVTGCTSPLSRSSAGMKTPANSANESVASGTSPSGTSRTLKTPANSVIDPPGVINSPKTPRSREDRIKALREEHSRANARAKFLALELERALEDQARSTPSLSIGNGMLLPPPHRGSPRALKLPPLPMTIVTRRSSSPDRAAIKIIQTLGDEKHKPSTPNSGRITDLKKAREQDQDDFAPKLPRSSSAVTPSKMSRTPS